MRSSIAHGWDSTMPASPQNRVADANKKRVEDFLHALSINRNYT